MTGIIRPVTEAERAEWLRTEIKWRRSLGESWFDARHNARRKLFLMDVEAAESFEDLRGLLRQVGEEMIWRR